MAQLNFTLDSDFFIGLFSKGKEEAFGDLMECILNQFLKAESAEVLNAANYERTEGRTDQRNGFRDRKITTRIGKLELAVPRHRNRPFHSVILESYRRNEQALISTMAEMVVQGVATRKIEKVTQELCGTKFSRSTVSNLCKALDEVVLEFKNRPLDNDYPFVMADAIYMKVREDHRVRSKALLVAIGVNSDGHKEVLGFDVCETETGPGWGDFFASLKKRGLRGIDLVISDAHTGLVSAIRSSFPHVGWQRCQVHFNRDIINKTPNRYQSGLATELREMFNSDTLEEAMKRRNDIMEEYQDVAPEAMDILDNGFMDAMNIMCLPKKYRKTLRTSNLIERENEELRRRETAIRVFPNQESLIRLMGAVLMDHHDDWSGLSRVFSMKEYYEKRNEFVFKLRSA